MFELNMGNWYNPLTPTMAVILLVISVLVECPIIWLLFYYTREKTENWTWRDWEIIFGVVGVNVFSFMLGYLFLVLNNAI